MHSKKLIPGVLIALATSWHAEARTTAADNTKRNKDTKNATTAESQSQESADVELAAKVRRALTADDKLSTYAHNVKIVVRDGRIELVGPVRSEDEKRTVASIAGDIAGSSNVTNNLSVAPTE